MRLVDIKIDNFLSVGSVNIDYRNQGLVLVEGMNHDEDSASSNGAGKSACISEPVLWCLYGITSRGVKSDAVINAKYGSGTKVALTFEKGDKTYVVTRYRKHKSGKNTVTVSCGDVDISRATNDETDALIATIVGLSAQTFSYAVLLGQGMTRRLTSLTDAGRKEVIEGLTHTDAFDRARLLSKRTADTKSSEHSNSVFESANLKQSIEDVDATLERLKQANKKEWEDRCAAAREAAASAKKELAEKEPAAKKAQALVADAKKKYDDAMPAIDGLGAQFSTVTSDLRVLESKIENLTAQRNKLKSGKCPTCLRSLDGDENKTVGAAFNSAIAVLTKECTPLRKMRESITSLRDAAVKAANGLKSSYEALHNSNQGVIKEVAMLRGRLDQAQQNLTRLEKAPPKTSDPGLVERKKELVKQLEASDRKAAASKTESEVYQYVTQVLRRARTAALTDAIEFLNARVGYYSKILTDGNISAVFGATVESKSGETLDKIGLAITTAGGSYQSASGGEADRIDLAISFALHDLVSLSSGQTHSVFVVDEPANYVDSTGLARVRDLLEAKLEDGVETVLVASQNPALKGMFENVWLAEKTDGVTSLVTV